MFITKQTVIIETTIMKYLYRVYLWLTSSSVSSTLLAKLGLLFKADSENSLKETRLSGIRLCLFSLIDSSKGTTPLEALWIALG